MRSFGGDVDSFFGDVVFFVDLYGDVEFFGVTADKSFVTAFSKASQIPEIFSQVQKIEARDFAHHQRILSCSFCFFDV